jgi:transglutaminase-like putative cysteine protease
MIRRIGIVFLFCLSVHHLLAGNISMAPEPRWLYTISPDPSRKPSSKEINNGYYLQLIDRQTNIGQQTVYTHLVRHIVNETGVQNASEVSVSFAPEYQQVVFHRLLLIRNGKTVSTLKLSEVKVVQEETDASDFQYNGIKRAFVVLKDVRKGDVIDVSYSVTGFNPVYNNRYSDETYFYASVAVANFFETIITPKQRPLQFQAFNGVSQPVKTIKDSFLVYQWLNPSLDGPETQENVPSWFNSYKLISVTEYKSWEEIASWGAALFKDYNYSVSPALNEKIASLHRQANGDRSKFIALATMFVQDQVRYLGMEIGTYTHKPHGPGEVFAQRFGDCKDKALLLITILRQKGITAYAALANTDIRSKLIDQDPSPVKFNHAIVAIAEGNIYRFIDATLTNQRSQTEDFYIPDYGYALVLRRGATGLEPVLPGTKKKSTVYEKLYVRPKEEGDAFLEIASSYEGGAAENNRNSFAELSISELEEDYRNYYAKYYDSIEIDSPVEIQDDSLANRILVKERYRIPGIWKKNKDGREEITVISTGLLNQLPDPSNSYTQGPLALQYPQDIHYTLELHMPSSWSFPFTDYHVSNPSFRFDYEITHKDSIIILDYRFQTFRDYIAPEDMAQYRFDYAEIIRKMQYEFYHTGQPVSNAYQPSAKTGFNWISFLYALLLTGILVLVFRKLNRTSAATHINIAEESGTALGGWVIVLGLTLLLATGMAVYNLYTNNYFSLQVWHTLQAYDNPNLHVLLLVEETMSLTQLCLLIAVCYWYLKRRDIFPRMFMIYAFYNIFIQMALLVLYQTVPVPTEFSNLATQSATAIPRGVVYATIWVTYVFNSQRVQRTFVEPYQSAEKNSHQELPEA